LFNTQLTINIISLQGEMNWGKVEGVKTYLARPSPESESTYLVKTRYIQHELRQNDRISTYYHIIPTGDMRSAYFATAWGDLFTNIALHLEHKPETFDILAEFWPNTVRYLMNACEGKTDDLQLMFFNEGFDVEDSDPVWLLGIELHGIPYEDVYSYFSDYTQDTIGKLIAVSAGLMMELDNEEKIYRMLREEGLADSSKSRGILELLPKMAVHQTFGLSPDDFRTLVERVESPWLSWIP
jgi:hypothetical protein